MKNQLNAIFACFFFILEIGFALFKGCYPAEKNLPLSQSKVLPVCEIDTPKLVQRITQTLRDLKADSVLPHEQKLRQLQHWGQFVQDSMPQDAFAGDLYHQIGLFYNNVYQNHTRSLSFFERGLKLREQYLDSLDEKLCRSYIMVGTAHTLLDMPQKAIPFLEKALDKLSKSARPDSNLKVKAYLELSGSFLDLGETEKSIDYLENGLTYKPSKHYLGEYHSRLGNGYSSKKQFEKAIEHYQKAIEHFETVSLDTLSLMGTLTNLSENYQLKSNIDTLKPIDKIAKIDSALQHLTRVMQLYNQLKINKLSDFQKIANANNIFGHCYKALKKDDLARSYYQKAIEALQKKGNIYPLQVSEAYQGLGNLALSKVEKLKYYHQAVGVLIPEFAKIQPNQVPKHRLASLSAPLQAVEALAKKAAILYDLTLQSKDYQGVTIATYGLLDSLILDLTQSYEEESAQFNLSEQTVPIYEKALSLSIQVRDTDAIFRYFDRNKAFLLKKGLFDRAAKRFAQLPTSVLQEEQSLYIKVAYWRKKLLEAEQTSVRDGFQKKLFEAKMRLKDFLEKVPQYKKYYDAKSTYDQSITLKMVQQALKDSMAVVSYYTGQDSIYMLAISKQKMDIQVIPVPDSFQQDFYKLRNCFIQDSSTTTEARKADFERLSPLFYDGLLRMPLSVMNTKGSIKRLKIIPDGLLGYLPFGLLMEQKKDWRPRGRDTLGYLIQNYAISYEYSLSLMCQDTFLGRSPSSSLFGGFGIQYDDFTINQMTKNNKSIERLTNSPVEVRQIQANIGGNIFTDDQCFLWGGAKTHKIFFLKEMNQHQILHLSMHAALNDRNPLQSGLIFTKKDESDDNILTVGELYAYHFNRNDLTVLSACNTANGKLYRGEGIMSLTRAITLAGASSVLSTLWSVGDQDMYKIMPRFYQNLQQGMEKDVALQQAQLAYLRTKPDLEPSKWAAPILTGNLKALKVQKASFWQKHHRKVFWILLLLGMGISYKLYRGKRNT